jgi:hypothetical protein
VAPELNLIVAEYWIIRRSLSSGAHSRDPVADDDGVDRIAFASPHNLSCWRDLRNLNNSSFPQTATLQRGKQCRDNIACR